MVRAADVLLECENAYVANGRDYASLVCESCYVSGDGITETGSVYGDLKKIYESQNECLHKIIITDRPAEFNKQIVESIKNRTAYIFIPPTSEVARNYVLQDYFPLFDYVARMAADNFNKCKSSYCKKCKSPRTRRLKLENRSTYWQVGKFCDYINSEYYNAIHVCPTG